MSTAAHVSLSARQESLIADLNLIPDPHERLSVLVCRAGSNRLPDALKTDDALVKGCVSRVWLRGELDGGRCRFRCEADSPLVKGLVALLCELYSGALPDEVIAVEPEVWLRCGFMRLLSPTRLNGLSAVRNRIRELATAMSEGASAE
ncbi:MAG: SufE family protein [Verrucomicrobiaceae bacterium]|nr:SufE family protein [Verrucomicrobiaceae bacterium]